MLTHILLALAGILLVFLVTGNCNFITKAFGLFVSMDRMIGADFEKGLAQLKSLVEAAPQA